MNGKVNRCCFLLSSFVVLIFADLSDVLYKRRANDFQDGEQILLKLPSRINDAKKCAIKLTSIPLVHEHHDMESQLRVKRQGGYNYDRPSRPFDLPSRDTGSTVKVAPRPTQLQAPPQGSSVAAPKQEQYYAYPAPDSSSSQRPFFEANAPNINDQTQLSNGYQPSRSINGPSSILTLSSSSSISSTSSTSSQSRGPSSYSYSRPQTAAPNVNAINDYSYPKPSPTAPPQPTSTTRGSYNYPQPSPMTFSQPSSTAGSNYNYQQPSISTADASFVSSTPGAPYLPPKPVTSSRPQPSSSTLGSTYLPPQTSSEKPLMIVVQDSLMLQSTSSRPPPTPTKSYIPPRASYLPPTQSPVYLSPASPFAVKSNLAPIQDYSPPSVTYQSTSSVALGKSYIPPSPTPFQRPVSSTNAPPTSFSTPASTYLPPY